MAAGTQITLADINANAGTIALSLDIVMSKIQEYKLWLDTQTVANLTTTYNMSTADANVLKSAFADMDNLRQIYQGLLTQGTTYDFRTFVKQVWGLGVH